MYRTVFPLAAVVGQDALLKGLLLTAVNPAIGGILIRGEKGTAKSTMVRALAAILPDISVVRECPFSCSPEPGEYLCPECQGRQPEIAAGIRQVRLINLPLNATEDRVAGGIDFPRSLEKGRMVFAPGLLAAAHRGLLYVDEVNLLDDHIVDLILDAAASGENRIEREGISFHHPACFILVGTMNPEEGELRPQLLDRFGLCLETVGAKEPEERVQLMMRREAYDRDPAGFVRQYAESSAQLAQRIAKARILLPKVRISSNLRGAIGEICRENHVAGHRADLAMDQAARALAAFQGRAEVSFDDIGEVAPLVLLHRRREAQPPPQPPEAPPEETDDQDDDRNHEHDTQQQQHEQAKERASSSGQRQEKGEQRERNEQEEKGKGQQRQDQDEQLFGIGTTFKVKPLAAVRDRVVRRGSGRRSRSRISEKKGRYVKSSFRVEGDIALDATLRAAAPYQRQRACDDGLAVHLIPRDLRGKVREKRIGNFLLFVVDASGSMGARGRMAASKGAVMSLLLDAYQKRDRVAMITFRRNEAVVNLPPTTSIDLAGRMLTEMPVGGRTPLSAGLASSHEQVRNYLIKNPTAQPIVIFITDGKCNVALGDQQPVEESLHLANALSREGRSRYIVVDTEEAGLVTFGLARRLAGAMEAQYFQIDDLRAETLVDIIKGQHS